MTYFQENRPPKLCIDPLIAVCSSACTRKGLHRNNGSENPSTLCVWIASFCVDLYFHGPCMTVPIPNRDACSRMVAGRDLQADCVSVYVLIINNDLTWSWSSGRCGFVSHCKDRSLRKLFIMTAIKRNGSRGELLPILNVFHTAVRIVWIIKPRETATKDEIVLEHHGSGFLTVKGRSLQYAITLELPAARHTSPNS